VVLQDFRGELTLLDRAGGPGGGEFGSEEANDEATAATPKAAAGVRRSSADMDDEIPF